MLLPLGDAPNVSTERPWANYGIIAANVVVYLWAVMTYGSGGAYAMWIHRWGFTPLEPRFETFFTSMFMHADFLHIAGNMLFLYIFGDNVEGRLGHLGYLLAYLASGLAALLLFYALAPGSGLPLVGASGAIFGVEGFYFLAFPRNRVRVMFWILLIWWTWVPARLFLGFYFVLNFFYMISETGQAMGGGVAYAAHVGGFVFGLGLAFALRAGTPSDDPTSTYRRARGQPGPQELMAGAHAALAAGDAQRADALLQQVLQHHVFDRAAPEAALQLGFLRARVLHRPEAARTVLAFAARMHPDPVQRMRAREELGRLT